MYVAGVVGGDVKGWGGPSTSISRSFVCLNWAQIGLTLVKLAINRALKGPI